MKTPIDFNYNIQMLRAISFLAVLIFHIDHSYLPGGYLGVDAFFLISGYLIIPKIISDHHSGEFKYTSFFKKRVLRLYPALMVTSLVTCFIGFYILLEDDFLSLLKSQAASSLFISNLYFYFNTDYFQTSVIFKPLLHFWSLSVEEQMYIASPLLLSLSFFRKTSVIAFFCIVSLIASEILSRTYPNINFFGLPTRLFEFGLGALFFYSKGKIGGLSPSKSFAIQITAILFILFSFLYFDDSTNAPNLLILPFLFSVGFIIVAPGNYNIKWLSSIGLASYSLYLVHNPVVMFSKILLGEGWVYILTSLFLTFSLGYLLFFSVENKFRFLKVDFRHTSFVVIGFAAFSVFCVFLFGPSKSADRYTTKRCIDYSSCVNVESDVLVIGDSIADSFYEPLSESLKSRGLTPSKFIFHSCPLMPGILRNEPIRLGEKFTNDCSRSTNQLWESLTNIQGKTIVYAIHGVGYSTKLNKIDEPIISIDGTNVVSFNSFYSHVSSKLETLAKTNRVLILAPYTTVDNYRLTRTRLSLGIDETYSRLAWPDIAQEFENTGVIVVDVNDDVVNTLDSGNSPFTDGFHFNRKYAKKVSDILVGNYL